MQRHENQNQEAAKSQKQKLEKSLKKLETEITLRVEFKAKTQRGSLARHPPSLL